jgi:hypothetical protein
MLTSLWDRHSDCLIEAVIKHAEDLSLDDIEKTGALWSSIHSMFAEKFEELALDLPDHSQWDWMKKVRHYLPKVGYGFVTIECEGIIQGLMLCNGLARSPVTQNERGEPQGIFYLEYLEAAPWNLWDFSNNPRFGAVGTRLLAFVALNAKMSNEFVGLHSLPNSVPFYLKHGFTDYGSDTEREDMLRYMELSEEGIDALIQKR